MYNVQLLIFAKNHFLGAVNHQPLVISHPKQNFLNIVLLYMKEKV